MPHIVQQLKLYNVELSRLYKVQTKSPLKTGFFGVIYVNVIIIKNLQINHPNTRLFVWLIIKMPEIFTIARQHGELLDFICVVCRL